MWIPSSLRGYDLTPEEFNKATPVPLPPVSPSLVLGEERDSWDENYGLAPYHPREWHAKPRLPGPGMAVSLGLGMKDVRNLGFGGGFGGITGRVLVF